MTIKRHGVGEGKGSGQRALPFAKATQADGWLYVSGQTPMRDGEIAGTVLISFLPDLIGRGWRGQLENVHVRAAARGNGIGSKMIAHAVERCRERGCQMVQLTSNKARHDAHRFYERLGFERSHEGMKLKL